MIARIGCLLVVIGMTVTAFAFDDLLPKSWSRTNKETWNKLEDKDFPLDFKKDGDALRGLVKEKESELSTLSRKLWTIQEKDEIKAGKEVESLKTLKQRIEALEGEREKLKRECEVLRKEMNSVGKQAFVFYRELEELLGQRQIKDNMVSFGAPVRERQQHTLQLQGRSHLLVDFSHKAQEGMSMVMGDIQLLHPFRPIPKDNPLRVQFVRLHKEVKEGEAPRLRIYTVGQEFMIKEEDRIPGGNSRYKPKDDWDFTENLRNQRLSEGDMVGVILSCDMYGGNGELKDFFIEYDEKSVYVYKDFPNWDITQNYIEWRDEYNAPEEFERQKASKGQYEYEWKVYTGRVYSFNVFVTIAGAVD